MVRTGSFGRLPRQAPDLSSAIAALLREMQQQEDQNFIDAWKNGGEVDGKPVNDARLLAHFRKRRNALSKDDPLWDEWDNRITQYTFAIEESKMSLKWDQGKVSEAQMSAFYRKWAHKATKNSEFRRTLESSAAKWAASAKGRASGGSSGSSQDGHDNWVKNFYERHVAAGEMLQDALVIIAQQYGAIPTSTSSYSPPTMADINPDSAGYGNWLDIYQDGKTNDDGVMQLIRATTKGVRRYDPDFVFDARHIDALLDRANEGLGTLVRRSVYKTERDDWQDRRGDIRQTQNHIQQAPIMQRVFTAQDHYIEAHDNCNGDPSCQGRVAGEFKDLLAKEQRRLLRGGLDEADMSVLPFIGQTIRYIEAAEDGKPIQPGTAGADRPTIFNLNGVGGADFLVSATRTWTSGMDALEAGGWVSAWPKYNQDGSPVLDDMGDQVYIHVVNMPNELVPTDSIPVSASDVLEDVPEGTRIFVTPSPVQILYTDPGGQTIPAAQVQPLTTDPVTGEATRETASAAGRAAYYEIPGIIGIDGKTRTVYRTGAGTAESPFLYHTNPPIPDDPMTGQRVQPRGDPETGARVFNVVGVWDPTAGADGKGAYVADVSAFKNANDLARVELNSGAYVEGTFRTSMAAAAQQTIDNIYDTHRPKPYADSMAQRMTASIVRESAMAAAAGDLQAAQDLHADAGQMAQTQVQRLRGNSGKVKDDYYTGMNSFTQEQQQIVNDLADRGITGARAGWEQIADRVRLIEFSNRFEEENPPSETLGRDLAQWALHGYVPPREQTPAEMARGARRQAMDVRIPVSQIKLPGFNPEPRRTVGTTVHDWLGGELENVMVRGVQAYQQIGAGTARPPMGGWEPNRPIRDVPLLPRPRIPEPKPPKPEREKPRRERDNPRARWDRLRAQANLRRSRASDYNRRQGTYYSYDPLSSISTRNYGGAGTYQTPQQRSGGMYSY